MEMIEKSWEKLSDEEKNLFYNKLVNFLHETNANPGEALAALSTMALNILLSYECDLKEFDKWHKSLRRAFIEDL